MKARLDEVQHHCLNASIDIRRTVLRWLQQGDVTDEEHDRLKSIFRAASRIEAACKGERMAKTKVGGWKTKTGAISAALGTALLGAAQVTSPEISPWMILAGTILTGFGGALAGVGIAHKVEKSCDGKQGGQ